MVRNVLGTSSMRNITCKTLALAFVLTALWAAPEAAGAQYHGVTHHRVSRRAARIQRPGWHRAPVQQQSVPEFDPNASGAALALLACGLAVILSSRAAVSSARL